MRVDTANLFQIRQLGAEALYRELGPVAMIRFFQQYETGRGDYSVERHEWLDNISVEEIAEKAAAGRK